MQRIAGFQQLAEQEASQITPSGTAILHRVDRRPGKSLEFSQKLFSHPLLLSASGAARRRGAPVHLLLLHRAADELGRVPAGCADL